MTTTDLIGKSVSFDHPDDPCMRLVGVVTSAKDNGRTKRGDIPDLLVTVRGASGAIKTLSFVESHMKVTS